MIEHVSSLMQDVTILKGVLLEEKPGFMCIPSLVKENTIKLGLCKFTELSSESKNLV